MLACAVTFALLAARSAGAVTLNYTGMSCVPMSAQDWTTATDYPVLYNLATVSPPPYITGAAVEATGSGVFYYFYCPVVVDYSGGGPINASMVVWDESDIADVSCTLLGFNTSGAQSYKQERHTTGSSLSVPYTLTWQAPQSGTTHMGFYCAMPYVQIAQNTRISNVTSYQVRVP
jgi:hypothetical protein